VRPPPVISRLGSTVSSHFSRSLPEANYVLRLACSDMSAPWVTREGEHRSRSASRSVNVRWPSAGRAISPDGNVAVSATYLDSAPSPASLLVEGAGIPDRTAGLRPTMSEFTPSPIPNREWCSTAAERPRPAA
jgi:hypothetical protein